MKFWLTLLLITSAWGSLAAQVLSFPEGNEKIMYLQEGVKPFLQINFKNETDNELLLDWETTQNYNPCTWTLQVCDNGFCHLAVPAERQVNNMMPVPPKGMGFVNMELKRPDCSCNKEGIFEYVIYPRQGSGNYGTVRFIYRCFPASRPEIQTATGLTVYPNPANEILNLSSEVKTAVVYDLFGKEIAHYQNSDRLNVQSLPAGVYQLKTEDYTGNVSFARWIKE